MISPTEEDKLADAVRRMKASAAAIREAQQAIAIAISDLEMDASICGQFARATEPEATKLRRAAGAMRSRLNRLEVSSVTIPADRLADAAWDKRHE